IRGHLPIGRGPTILLVYGTFLAVVVAMALVVVPVAMGQLGRTIASLPPFFERASAWAKTLHPSGLANSLGALIDAAANTLGVPAGILLGLVAALAEGIPIVGPLLGAIPAVLVASTVSPQLALTVVGVYFVLQLIEGNVLVPLVMRNTTGISPFLVILSILIGGAAGGFVGALLAVPIAAAGEVLIEGLQAREVPAAQDPNVT